MYFKKAVQSTNLRPKLCSMKNTWHSGTVSTEDYWVILQWMPSDVFHALENKGHGIRSIILWWSLKVQHVCFASRVASGKGRQDSMALLKQGLPLQKILALLPCSSITVCVIYLICRILTFWLFFTATPRQLRITVVVLLKISANASHINSRGNWSLTSCKQP